ncbi:MAG: DUF1156 domain-containing protein [Chloroflexi bacterium]|nr:DUF1156 domain-containing protein [Chloroflexota bacterium]
MLAASEARPSSPGCSGWQPRNTSEKWRCPPVKLVSDDRPRLIEVAFPLKQASLGSVRHGHILTLHIWSGRRPLAARRELLAGGINQVFHSRE